jgi:MSHA biogenesis protein MshQ
MSRLRLVVLRLLVLRLLALALLGGAATAHADTPITLWKAYDGRVNFAGTQVSLRTRPNGAGNRSACTVTAPSTNRSATLRLPSGATVVSAQLYWAGSGTSDSTVTFEGRPVTASRRYTSSTIGDGYNYFGGAADVTGIVRLKGGGTYNFSGLTVANGNPWCASEAVLGGFSLLVVYSHPSEPERVLNLYEGFRYMQNSEVVVNASNFRWNRTMVPVEEKARVGHITWEGDANLAQNGEHLLFEGTEMTDSLNPEGNQFNSKSNINNSSASYGIDFDAYDTSVVIWSGYDAQVTTSYRSGQDLVLLNAEVLLVPTMPVSDLSVAIARPGALQVGRNAVYTVTVTNNGPYSEAGPVTVNQTLPAGMGFVSGGGTDWSCVADGATVTCTYRAALASDTNAAPLTVTAAVNTTGEKTTTVSVQGTDDDNAANNTASNTGTAAAASNTAPPAGTAPTSYVFTDSKCVAGIPVGALDKGQTCKPYGAATVGGSDARIYLTALSEGVPTAPSKTSPTNVSMQFALDCVNPSRGTVGATYGGHPLPPCAAAGLPASWSASTTVTFAPDEVSVARAFFYNDIGKVKLSLMESAGSASTREFVVAPLRIDFRSIRYGTVANPQNTSPGSDGFAPAGAKLTLEIGALLAGSAGYAPNFGNEDTRPELRLFHSKAVDLVSLGELTQSAPDWTKRPGFATIEAAWSEVGAIHFETGLLDPASTVATDSSGPYLGVQTPGGKAAVGRFYPAYFKTIVTGPFDCPKGLPDPFACPRDDKGAVYSRQPFDITLEAYNASNELLKNFNQGWFRDVTLGAVTAWGGTPTATRLASATGAATVVITSPPRVVDPVSGAVSYPLLARASFQLDKPYVDALPPPAVSDPRKIHVRAVAGDTGLPGPVEISSLRPDGEVSDEGGILVLNGRLKVPNALGTDTLITPLGLRAEYYAGTAGWLFHPGFADPLGGGVTAGEVAVLACTGSFLDDGETCGAVTGAAGTARIVMKDGKGVLRLRAPGKRKNGVARNGTVTLRYNGWTWLPSTTGRVTFGSKRSPVIYVRELYF